MLVGGTGWWGPWPLGGAAGGTGVEGVVPEGVGAPPDEGVGAVVAFVLLHGGTDVPPEGDETETGFAPETSFTSTYNGYSKKEFQVQRQETEQIQYKQKGWPPESGQRKAVMNKYIGRFTTGRAYSRD